LVEALVAITILALAGSVLLSASHSSMSSASLGVDATIAQGIARQVMDEAMGLPYVAKTYTSSDPNAVLLTNIGSAPRNSGRRDDWDDLDDYNGTSPTSTYSAQPACDRWGQKLGLGDSAARGSSSDLRHPNFRLRDDYFHAWQIETNVYYLNPSDLTQRQTAASYYRAIEVRVSRIAADGTKVQLENLRRVHCHVPK
jgi:type II secretory pathway pseudopilin PulG